MGEYVGVVVGEALVTGASAWSVGTSEQPARRPVRSRAATMCVAGSRRRRTLMISPDVPSEESARNVPVQGGSEQPGRSPTRTAAPVASEKPEEEGVATVPVDEYVAAVVVNWQTTGSDANS